MVSVTKKTDKSVFQFFREKSLKFQMMVKFLLLALSVEIAIAILIIFSTKATTEEIVTESSSYVEQRQKSEMTVIAEQMTNVILSTLFNLSLLASEISESITMVIDSDYKQYFPQQCSTDNFLNPAAYTSTRDFSTFAFLMNPQPTSCTTSGTTKNYEDIVSLDNVIPPLLTDYTRERVRRISVYYIDTANSANSFLRVYPKDALIETYNINDSLVMSRFSTITTLSTEYVGQDRVLISGPDYDSKKKCDSATPCELLFSLAKITSPATNTYYITEIELYVSIFEDILGNQNYKSSIEFCILGEISASSTGRTVAYAPSYWDTYDSGSNADLDFFYSKVITYSGLNEATFSSMIGSSSTTKQTMVNKKNSSGQTKQYLVNVLRINGYILQDTNMGYLNLDSTTVTSPPGFDILIFGESSQMLESSNSIKDLTLKQEYATIVIGVISGFITLIMVLFVTYCVASKLAQPLRRLIKMVKRLNNNTMHIPRVQEQTKRETEELLSQSEYQVADLISSFQLLIETVEARGKQNEQGEEVQPSKYPLNQYEESFVEKAKGRSDINWKALSKLIENEPKFSQKK